ncbi:hypothetical protein H310_10387 [Aphanomyces invadans]|uniref:C2 domain-containing protein n=1 Tax=Aphanomyces invadans TaxID=157072 RepID=A0A024TQ84_9STRA|nr:hypothetical protein H310_10387 [Aphanomyces invadans]ETV96193.1 hypothetical protein H310_10387 [Aphanomyces invadans]|eukprot:XP_008874985.1 hypothetical protein H310_10387 [Aphanomyces invadans]
MASFQVQFSVGGLKPKADAFIVLYLNGAPVGRTETIHNVPNPSFLQSFKVDAPLGGEILKIEVYDEEKSSSKSLKDQDLLGIVEVPVKQLVDNLAQITTLRTSGGGARGLFKKEQPPLNVYVQTELMNPTLDVLVMQWSAKDLTNLDGMFNKSDPVLFLGRMVQDGSFLPAFRTEVIDGNLNPVWQQATVTLQRLANGDLDRPLLAQVFDMDNGEKKRELIGQVQTSARALLELPTLFLLSASGKPAGSLRPLHMRLQQSPPFVGFAPGACPIQAIQGLVAPPPAPVAAVPLHDKLSHGFDYATSSSAPGQEIATAVPEVAPLAVPIDAPVQVVAAPVATKVDWLVKVHSQDGGQDTTVVFINSTSRAVDIVWVAYEGDEHFYNRIEPGHRYEQPTISQHSWKIAFSDTQEPLAYFLAPLTNSVVDIHGVNQIVIGANLQPMQPGDLSDSIPTVLEFANCTPGVLSIRWVDSDQTETQYAVLQPGESYRQDTYSNHVWKATYIASDTALAFVSAPREPTHVDVCGFNQLRLTRL